MFKNYVDSILSNRPFQPMFDADQGGGGGAGAATDPGAGTDPGTDPGAGTDPGDDKPGGDDNPDGSGGGDGSGNDNHDDNKVTFTDDQQAFINQLINNTIKKEREKAEAERKKELDRAKMDEDQRRQADLDDAQKKLDQFKQKAVAYEIQDVARDMGVPANRLDRFIRLVDREEIEVDDDGSVDRSKVSQVVKAVLGDFPEFKASGNSQGPAGDYNKGSGSGAKFSLAQIKDMSPQQIKENWDDVQKSMSIHNKK